jgi:hypothetical protein
MSNYTEAHDKLAIYLQELYVKHRSLDDEVKMLYNTFASDEIINRKKTQKLWIKDEMHRIETQLKDLG